MKKRAVAIILILLIMSIVLPVIGFYIGGNAKSISYEDVTNIILKGTTEMNLKTLF